MRIVRITCAPVYLSSRHGPEIGYDIHIMLRDVCSNRVDHRPINYREHCSVGRLFECNLYRDIMVANGLCSRTAELVTLATLPILGLDDL